MSDCEPESSTSPDPPDEGAQVATPASAGDAPTSVPEGSRRRRKHPVIVWSSVALVVLLVASAGFVVAARINSPLPQPAVAGRVSAWVVPGSAPVQPWPARGQAAVAIPALGYAEQSGPEAPVPIASLTKMTTALVVLRDHPVPHDSSGPTITITPDDAAQFGVDLADDQTNIPLLPGETLTELQLLEALLIRSADDAAYTLAAWDAGSQQAFVAKMNVLALSLGALHSHYADTSGFDPRSVSTAADTLRIAAAGMAIPTFASVAAMPSANVPGAGTIRNIVTAIGTDGLVGVKSGYTSQASGCMVLAAYRFVHGRSVLVLASALGESEPAPAPPPLTAPTAAVPTAAVPTAAVPTAAVPTTTTTTAAAPTNRGSQHHHDHHRPLQPARGAVPAPLHRADRRAPARHLGGGHRAGAGGHRRTDHQYREHRVGKYRKSRTGRGRQRRLAARRPRPAGGRHDGTLGEQTRRSLSRCGPVHPRAGDRDRAGAAGPAHARPRLVVEGPPQLATAHQPTRTALGVRTSKTRCSRES